MDEQHAALIAAVKKMHAARGRYHNQLATAELYKLVGLPYVMPGDPPPPMQDGCHVRATPPTDWGKVVHTVCLAAMVIVLILWGSR